MSREAWQAHLTYYVVSIDESSCWAMVTRYRVPYKVQHKTAKRQEKSFSKEDNGKRNVVFDIAFAS
jgi:hypothetical protein